MTLHVFAFQQWMLTCVAWSWLWQKNLVDCTVSNGQLETFYWFDCDTCVFYFSSSWDAFWWRLFALSWFALDLLDHVQYFNVHVKLLHSCDKLSQRLSIYLIGWYVFRELLYWHSALLKYVISSQIFYCTTWIMIQLQNLSENFSKALF